MYGGNALVHVKHGKSVLIVVLSGEVGVFRRERTDVVARLLAGTRVEIRGHPVFACLEQVQGACP